MAVNIGDPAASGFDDPVGLLSDCHRRVERFLATMRDITWRRRGGPLDGEHRAALETAFRYFQQAAPRHTEDEEASLFPRLRGSRDPRIREAMAKMDGLEADHQVARELHAQVDDWVERWLQDSHLPVDQADRLTELLAALQEHYARHIAVEDEELFPLAQQVLSGEDLAAIGREMADRRAQAPGRPGSRCAARRSERMLHPPRT
ncbi:MAG: hypothetical protein BIFFINMI_04200 [Phycisphaerae bacterium]|nr:hypothetical protein [Phycisphaerae bacterium]